MKDAKKTKKQLISELAELRQRIAELEKIETEHRQAEEALRKSEERYKKQFQEAMDAILIADAETGIIVDCNRAASELVGREKSELVGKHQRILHPPEEIEGELSRTFKQHLKEKEGQVLETKVITKEGEIKDVAIKANIFELEGQNLILGIFRDITEQRRMEEALRETEENFRAVAENANDGILVAVGEGVHVYVNKRATEITGYSVAELLETDMKGLVHPDEFEKVMERYRKRLAGKPAPTRYETIFIRKDGKSVPVEFTAAKTVWQGEPASVVFFRDITERKRVEEALRESEEKYRNLIERANDGIVIVQETIIRYANPRLAEMWGGTVQEFIGTPFTDHVHPDELPKVVDRYKRRMAGQNVTPIYETVLRRKDGSKLYAELNAGIITYQGKSADLVIIRDITERKRAEEAYRAVVDYSLQGLVIVQDFQFVFANQAFAEISGYTVEELLSLSSEEVKTLVHPEDQALVWGRFRDRLEGKPLPPRYEYRGIRKDGTMRWLAMFANGIMYHGRPAVQAAIVDITERKQAEEEAQKRLRDLTALHEVSEVINATLDLKEVFQRVVEGLSHAFGYHVVDIYLLEEDGLRLQANTGYDDQTAIDFMPLERGVIGRTARTGQPAFISNVSQDPDYLPSSPDITSQICVPIKSGETLLGVLNVECDQRRPLTEDDLLLLHTLSSHIGVAIDNARLFEDTESHLAQLSALQETSKAVASTLQLDELLNLITHQATTLLQADGGIINLVDWEKNEDEVAAGAGSAASTLGYRSPLEGSLSGWVTLHNQPVISNQLQNDSRADRRPHSWLVDGMREQTQTAAIAPLTIKDQVIGTLVVMDKQGGKGEFDQTDLDLLVAFANQAGTAIENARLFQESQKRADEISALRRVNLATLSTLERDQVFEIMLDQLGTVIDYDTAAIKIITPDGRDKMIAGRGPIIHDQAMWNGFDVKDNKLVQEMKETRQTVVVHDARTDERYERVGKWEAFRSWVGAPLFVKGDFVGYLAVEKTSPGFYDEKAVQLLGDFASGAAIALENARLYEEAQKRLRETTVLHKVAEVINATLDLREIFQRVVEELSQTFGYPLLGIYLLDGAQLRLGTQIGYDLESEPEFISMDRGVVGRVARTGQPVFIPDVTQDPDYIPDDPGTTSEICVPIMSGQTILGVLNVEGDDKKPLTKDDLLLLHTLSSHIGVAIENARLYEAEQRRSAQRRTIAEVGRKAAAILEMDTLLPQVADLIAQNFGYHYVHIFQIDPDSGYAVYKAGTGKAGRAIVGEGFRLKVREEGIIGWVAGHGEPLLINDVSQEPRYYPHPALPDTHSELAVPIRAGGGIIGVLDVQSTERDAFDESDLATLETLAHQLAVAMENARLYEETQRLAITDGLTGLYNLRYFYSALEKEIQRSERYHRSVSLIILDIDDFKAYNDLYGHLAGDDLLRELSQLMSKVTRQTDTLARYGGEEFAIILPETEIEGAGFLAERLLEGVREHRFSTQDGQTIGRITISLGVAAYPHHAHSAKSLVDAADKALLRAKRAGKNRLSVCKEELTELQP